MANPRIDELRKRLDREPGSRLFGQLAEELRKDGELVEAIRVARIGLAAHPNYPSARMTLGRALFDTGDLAAARGELELVLRGAPENILASRMLAECLEGLGDHGAALLQFRAALRLAPGDRQTEVQIKALEQRLAGVGGSRPAPPPMPAATAHAAPAAHSPQPPLPPAPPVSPQPPPPPPPPAAQVRPASPPLPATAPPLPPPAPRPASAVPAAAPTPVEAAADFDDVFETAPSWQRAAPTAAAPEEGDSLLLLEDEAPTLPGTPYVPPRSAGGHPPAEPALPAPAIPLSTVSPEPPRAAPPPAPPMPPAAAPPVPPPLYPVAPPVLVSPPLPEIHRPEPSVPPVSVAPQPRVEAVVAPPASPSPALDFGAPPPVSPQAPLTLAFDPASAFAGPLAPEAEPPTTAGADDTLAGAPAFVPAVPATPLVAHEPLTSPSDDDLPVAAVGESTAAFAALSASLPFAEAPVVEPVVPTPPLVAEHAAASLATSGAGDPSAETPGLSTPTLAELYFDQGFTDKAIQVYEELLEREPQNERARARLIEIKALTRDVAVAAPADPRAERRLTLERKIARLEELLAVVRRG